MPDSEPSMSRVSRTRKCVFPDPAGNQETLPWTNSFLHDCNAANRLIVSGISFVSRTRFRLLVHHNNQFARGSRSLPSSNLSLRSLNSAIQRSTKDHISEVRF